MSKRGRPVSKRRINEENDALLSLFPDNDTILTFTQLHIGLYEREIVSKTNKSKTSKIIQRLIKENKLLKIDTGRYKAKIKPDEFKLFNYLYQLRESVQHDEQFYIGSVGGNLWRQNDLYFLGLPRDVENDPLARFVMEILSIRLSNLYVGMKELSHYLQRKQRYPKINVSLSRRLVRELLLEIVPYYLGSKAGIDGDGLHITELRNLTGEIISTIPMSVNYDGYGSHTYKEYMTKDFETTSELLDESLNSIFESSDYIVNQSFTNDPEFKHGHFAIILTDPDYLIDEDAHQRRNIFQEIIELNHLGDSATEIAGSLLLNEELNVLEVLENYAYLEIGRKKTNELKRIYKKMVASRNLAITMGYVDEGFIKNEETRNLITKYREQGITTRDLVYYLPFCLSDLNFVSPTQRKKQIIYSSFPTVPREKIDEWYESGVEEAKQLIDKTLDRLHTKWSKSER